MYKVMFPLKRTPPRVIFFSQKPTDSIARKISLFYFRTMHDSPTFGLIDLLLFNVKWAVIQLYSQQEQGYNQLVIKEEKKVPSCAKWSMFLIVIVKGQGLWYGPTDGHRKRGCQWQSWKMLPCNKPTTNDHI